MRVHLTIPVIALCLITMPLVVAEKRTDAAANGPTGNPASGPPAKPVVVVNFPDPQNVAGTVDVGNFPATQEVTGSVNVESITEPVQVVGEVEVTNSGGAPRFRLVGVTTATFPANAGWFPMTAACHAEFSGSRMAFSDEVFTTIDPPVISVTAWLHPRPLVIVDNQKTFDVHGNLLQHGANNNANCLSWSNNTVNGSGTVVTPSGHIRTEECTNTFAVACSAPE